MKKLFASLVTVALMGTYMAWATETLTYAGSATSSQWFSVPFVTNRPGAVTVTAQWQPKSTGKYELRLVHLIDPNDLYSYDQYCDVYTGDPGTPPPGAWTCKIAAGLPGHWLAFFRPYSGGRVSFATLTIAAETD